MRKLIGLILIGAILFGMYNAYNNFKGEGTSLTGNLTSFLNYKLCEHDWRDILVKTVGSTSDRLLGKGKTVQVIWCANCEEYDEIEIN